MSGVSVLFSVVKRIVIAVNVKSDPSVFALSDVKSLLAGSAKAHRMCAQRGLKVFLLLKQLI